MTDVVTLQRDHEMAGWIPALCAEQGITWHHLPLSGKRLELREDREVLRQLPGLLERLRPPSDPPRRVVLHCSAGLHRTGVCLYLLARLAGASPEEALAQIAIARPLTARELRKRTRKTGVLVERAEALLDEPLFDAWRAAQDAPGSKAMS